MRDNSLSSDPRDRRTVLARDEGFDNFDQQARDYAANCLGKELGIIVFDGDE